MHFEADCLSILVIPSSGKTEARLPASMSDRQASAFRRDAEGGRIVSGPRTAGRPAITLNVVEAPNSRHLPRSGRRVAIRAKPAAELIGVSGRRSIRRHAPHSGAAADGPIPPLFMGSPRRELRGPGRSRRRRWPPPSVEASSGADGRSFIAIQAVAGLCYDEGERLRGTPAERWRDEPPGSPDSRRQRRHGRFRRRFRTRPGRPRDSAAAAGVRPSEISAAECRSAGHQGRADEGGMARRLRHRRQPRAVRARRPPGHQRRRPVGTQGRSEARLQVHNSGRCPTVRKD